MKKIVFIGGGTGLSTILSGIKKYPYDISAIVAMTDDGFSTGRLRKDFNTLPPGDLRKCLIALSDNSKLLTQVFNYRFRKSKGLSGHSLGNLLILSLEKITGSFANAITEASKILSIRGNVIPSTLDNINLVGKLENGKEITGERKLFLTSRKTKSPIKNIWLKPQAKANPIALEAIKNADYVIIGPGSLYTSILPNLLINEINEGIIKNKTAKKIYICNVSTERGETQGFGVSKHIQKLQEYTSTSLIDYCLVNSKIISTSKKEYKLGEINNITTKEKEIFGVKIILKDIINKKNPLYHDNEKLASNIHKIICQTK